MGKVGVSLKVMPTSIDVDMEKVKAAIAEKLKIEDAKIEPIAFGLKALKLLILTEDKGGTDEIETTIKAIEGVADVEVESVSLI